MTLIALTGAGEIWTHCGIYCGIQGRNQCPAVFGVPGKVGVEVPGKVGVGASWPRSSDTGPYAEYRPRGDNAV
jgi:hypothetical protein